MKQDDGQVVNSHNETTGGKIKFPAAAVCVMICLLLNIVMVAPSLEVLSPRSMNDIIFVSTAYPFIAQSFA